MKANQVLKKIGEMLGVNIKLEQQTLADGVTIIEAEMFEAGNEVFIVMEDEMVPLPIGEYEMQDGRMLVVAQEGMIAEIKEAGSSEEAPVEEVEQSEERMPKRIIESITKEHHFEENKQEPKDEPKKENLEEATAEEVVDAVVEAEEEVIAEVVQIVNELTPESVDESDASEIAYNAIDTMIDVLEEMPEEVSAKALTKSKKYGKKKMTEEEGAVVEEAQGQLVEEMAKSIDAGTDAEITPEISEEIAQVIIEAVVEIVDEAPEELRAKLFKKRKVTKASKIKNSKVRTRVEMAKRNIENLQSAKAKPSAKRIKHNPERKVKQKVEFKIGAKRQETMTDRIFNRLFK